MLEPRETPCGEFCALQARLFLNFVYVYTYLLRVSVSSSPFVFFTPPLSPHFNLPPSHLQPLLSPLFPSSSPFPTSSLFPASSSPSSPSFRPWKADFKLTMPVSAETRLLPAVNYSILGKTAFSGCVLTKRLHFYHHWNPFGVAEDDGF